MHEKTLPDSAASKHAAQYLLRNGLATYAEISAVSGWSRQTIRYWAVELAAESARQDQLDKLWTKAMRHNE